jgi:hypothetical protein
MRDIVDFGLIFGGETMTFGIVSRMAVREAPM